MIINKITSLPRNVKTAILLASDIVFLIVAILLSFTLRLGYLYFPPGFLENQITWLILLSIFYIETTVTLIVRIIRRENVFKSHHSLHAYQQIVIRTGRHNRPAIFSIIISIVWTIPMSILSYNFPYYGFYITLITCIPLSLIFYLYGPKIAKEKPID